VWCVGSGMERGEITTTEGDVLLQKGRYTRKFEPRRRRFEYQMVTQYYGGASVINKVKSGVLERG
jgi:hypothetical protein